MISGMKSTVWRGPEALGETPSHDSSRFIELLTLAGFRAIVPL